MSDDDKSLPESLITPEQVQSTFSAAPIHEEPKPEEKVETPDETLPDMITPDVVKSTFSREPIKSLNKVEQFASKYEKGDINQISPEETRVMSLWTPQEWHDLKKLRPDLAIPDNKAREIFDAKRAGQIVDKEGPGLLTQLGQGAKSFAHGVELLFEDKNPYVKDPVTGEYPISDVEKLRALGSAPLKVGEAANYLAAHAINEPIPSLWGFTDWVGEKLGHQTPDDTFKKEQARNLIDTARAADERAHQSIYSRYAQTPAVKNAIKGGLTLLGADKDTSPEALDSHAQKIADRWSASQNYPVNPDIELVSSFLAPKGLGMEDFAVATTALGAFQKALKIPAAIRGVEAEQALQARKTLDAVDKASKVGVFTKAAGKTADALDNLSTSLEEFKKARPYTAGVLSTVPGVIIGSQMDKEHPIAGAVLGGLGEGAAVKYLGKAAANAPRILADLGEARAITAGGGKLFETAGAAAEKGSATEKIFGGFKGRTLDKLSDLATSYGRGGIDMLGLGAALGAIKGEDWEDTKNAMGQGLAYGLFHQTLGKMMGQDPIVHQRNLHRKDIEFTKQLQQMSPETQDTVLHFQDWDTHLGLLQKQLSDAQGRYGEAVKSGDQEEASKAGNLVNQISDQLQRGSNADLHTRQAYARSIGDLFTDALRAANGPFREGQKNIGMEILNTNQIAQKLQANNPGMTPQAAQGITSMGHFFSPVGGGRGIELGGNIPDALKPVVEGKVFDPLKSTVVMNADLIKDGIVNRNQTPAEAFRHEWGHALWSIPEFKDLMIANGVEEGLFDTTYTDLNGNPQRVTQGQFSNKDLNDRFWDEYLKNIRQDPGETQKQAQERYAKNLGMWDDSNKRWDEDKIANYMKNEVRADVYGKGLGGTGLDSLDSVSQHILDWTRVKVKNSLAKRAVEGILGHGGSDPYNSISSPATGVNNLSPELLSAYRNAFREFKDLNGQVTQSNDEGRIMPVISPLKMAKSASLRQKYGRDSGLFKTEFRATVYDKDGKPTGSVTLPGQNIFEGVWGSESGSLVQRSGYGAAPADIEGMPVPPGGTIKISREIVMKPDGETPEMLSRKEIKDLAKTRAQTIRDAIDTSYKGEPNGFRSVSEDGLTYRGTFTPEQIAAIRALPEAVVPAKIKDTILRFNDLLAKGEGHRMLIDYAARVDDKGRAVAFSPKTYDLVPIGMHFSKDGNFLITTVSVSRLLDKINLWGDRFSGRLALWGGDKEAFFREFATKYLPNHLEKWQNPDGPDKPLVARPGETELDPDPKVALQKKHVFNDFLNLTSNEFRDRNPDRTIIPRRKGDPRGKFPDRTIMSVRADAVADMLESSAHPLPVNYELQKWNFLPAKEPGLSFAPKGDEPALKPTEENPILKGMGATGRTPYAQPVRSANQDVRDISKQYVESVGLPYNPHGQAVPVDEALAKRIADHYEEAKHDPNDPKVKKAYTALANETVDQWKSFQKAGYTATPWTGKGQPYANSAEMMKDVRDNKHLYYFPTESGFGTEKNTPAENPMLEDSGVNFNGAENVPVNDVFRVVHDIVGHGANGYEFGPKGEFNAYLEHSRMFSKEAKPALAAETLAQNSWVNFGPHLRDAEGNLAKKGEQGYVPVTERPFAEQKNLALPQEFIDSAESQAGAQSGPSYLPAKKLTAQHPSKEKEGSVGGELDLVHFGPYGIKTTDPKKFGKGIATPVDLQGDYKTYFYLNDGRNYEGSMRGKVPYVAKVDGNSIYNLEQDPLGVNSMPNRLKRDETIQEAGYAGYFSPKSFNGSFDAVALYKPTKLTEVQEGKEIFKSKKQSKDFGMQYLPAKKGVDGEPETEERVNPYTNEPKNATPTGATSAQNYPAAQGSGAEDSEKRAGERLRFHSGLAAVARAASSSSEEGLPGAKGAVPRKELEEQALRDHADEHGLWTDPEAFFKQWQFDGSEAGGEHQVSFPSGPDVIKRTYNPYYPTWASYFDAMNVHNTLFPKAALTFRGFQDVKGSGGVDIYQGKWPAGLYSEVSQPTLEIARGLKMDETDAMMEPLGFYRVRPMEYYNPELKIHMTDLHPQNAVMLRDEKGNEFPYVIDSNIHATGAKAYDAEDVAKVEAKLAAKENPILSALQPPAPGDTGFSFLGAKGRPGITAATELAKEKVDELKTKLESADDDFFTKLWPSLLKKTGLNLKASSQNLGKAASIAVNDVVDWLKTNKKYQDYYHTDRETTKQLLKQEYPEMTEDDFKGFMMFMGLTSPSTKLKENVGEALRVFDLWKNEGSVKSLSLIKTPKGNAGVGSGPFKLIGPTAANKLRTLHYMEDLHKKLGSWDEVSKHLQEPVSMKELNAFNRELGYSGGIGKAGEVKQVVKEATGQDQLIPRMFVFGPKVGAYTLNHVGDDRYTTTDIWEGRFVRSHFPEMFKKGSGLPTNVSEHKIFQTFSSKFNETFKEKTGLDLSPAALQAARWFFMIAKANEAGYKHAKTNGTISEYTEEALRKLRSRTFDADREGSNQEDSEGVE